MTWNGFAFKLKTETGSTLLHPAPTPQKNGIESEPDEGDLQEVATITGVKVSVGSQSSDLEEVLNQGAQKGSLYLSEDRIAFSFSKFDTTVAIGTGSLAVVAGVANLVSAARKRDYMLLGHVRFPWLSSIGFATKSGWLSREALVLTVCEDLDDVRLLYELDMTLDKRSDAARIAQDLLSRCEEQRSRRYENYAGRSEPLDRGEFTIWRLPQVAAVGQLDVETPDEAERRRARQGLSVDEFGGDPLAEGMVATLTLLDEFRTSRIAKEFRLFGDDFRRALDSRYGDGDVAGYALTGTHIDENDERFLALVLTLQDRILMCAKVGRQRHSYDVTEIPRSSITGVTTAEEDPDGGLVVEVLADRRWRFEIDSDDDCPPELKEQFLSSLRS